MEKKKSIKLMMKIFLCFCLLISFSSCYVGPPPPRRHRLPPPPAGPPPLETPPAPLSLMSSQPVPLDQPPLGKVWAQIDGTWALVPVPPSDGPYVWLADQWVISPPPPGPGYEWVPGFWNQGYWYPGHWELTLAPSPEMIWVPGRWDGSLWVAGYWSGQHPQGLVWVPGHRGPHGEWIPGHWVK